MPQGPATSKPGRIKSILDYLQQDVPKVGGSEESVEGEDMGASDGTDVPVDINGVAKVKSKRSTKVV